MPFSAILLGLLCLSFHTLLPEWSSQSRFTRWRRAWRSLVVIVLDVESISESDLPVQIHITLTDGCGRARRSLVVVILEIEGISESYIAISIAVTAGILDDSDAVC